MSPVGDALDVPAVPVERLSQHDPDGLERTLETFEAPGLQSVLEPCELCQHESPHRMNPFTLQPPPPQNESPHRMNPLTAHFPSCACRFSTSLNALGW